MKDWLVCCKKLACVVKEIIEGEMGTVGSILYFYADEMR